MKKISIAEIKFTWKEVLDITLAVIVLGFLFTLTEEYPTYADVLINYIQAIILIGLGFVFHELGHKVVAQSLGASAYFQLWTKGLIISIIIGLITLGKIIFFAPGYVLISATKRSRFGFKRSYLNLNDNALISAAGPTINLAMALGFKLFSPLLPVNVWFLGTNINAWLALFNLLPFPPLDGSKVFFWNRVVWTILFLSSLAALILLPYISLILTISLTTALILITILFMFQHKLT